MASPEGRLRFGVCLSLLTGNFDIPLDDDSDGDIPLEKKDSDGNTLCFRWMMTTVMEMYSAIFDGHEHFPALEVFPLHQQIYIQCSYVWVCEDGCTLCIYAFPFHG